MKILNKENREIVTTVVAVAALAISLTTLTMGEFRYRKSIRPDFSIALEQEYNGPISILESDGNGYFEGFVKLTIYNHGEQSINISSIDASMKNKAIVLHSDKWHPGVIPIITARISKQYNRPCMLIALEGGIGKGSIRTIPEFPLLNVLKENEEFLVNFGGHDFAAGLSVTAENIETIRNAFIEAANKQLQGEDITPKLFLDSEIRFDDLTFDFLESLSLLEPYGNGNPPPLLYADARQTWFPKIVGKSHLKLYLEQDDRMLEGIGFGMASKKADLRKKHANLRIVFTPYINNFLNKSSIQLQLKDFQVKEE